MFVWFKNLVLVLAQWKQTQLVSAKTRVQSLVFLHELRIRRCYELWCRSQTQLGSHIAVAVAVTCSCSSDSTLSLGTFICLRWVPKKTKKKKKKKNQILYWKVQTEEFFPFLSQKVLFLHTFNGNQFFGNVSRIFIQILVNKNIHSHSPPLEKRHGNNIFWLIPWFFFKSIYPGDLSVSVQRDLSHPFYMCLTVVSHCVDIP